MPVYLKAKKARAPKDLPYHTAVAGDTPWTIAQRYGIRVNSLYALNNWEAGEQPSPGDRVVLR
jgi:LysM repeat protein